MKSATGHDKAGSIELLENTFYIFRTAGPQTLATYYSGAIPFILGLLYFQADMSRSPFASSHCASASLGLTLLFLWMKYCQAVFMLKIEDRLYHRPPVKLTISGICRLMVIQAIVQPSGFFILPLASILCVPFAWVYAFYQNALTCPVDQPFKLRAFLKSSGQKAVFAPGQNHFLILFHCVFSMFVMINVCAGLMMLPGLLKTFFNVETQFSMSVHTMLNTTFIFTAMGITYLCVDPLVKISYALRGVQATSTKTADDLKAEFKFFTKQAKNQANKSLLVGSVFLLLFCGTGLWPAQAGQQADNTEITRQSLDRSIEQVMANPEFTWRMPRQKMDDTKEAKGFAEEIMAWIADQIKKVADLFNHMEKLLKWLQKLFPESDHDAKFLPGIRVLLITISIGLVCFLLIWGIRKIGFTKKPDNSPDKTDTRQIIPNLADEDVRADQLPSDSWFCLAEELMAKGDFRMALRAFYLCTLSVLGEARLITIAQYKSNFDYNRELQRRAHEKKNLLGLFKQNIVMFEKTWYGMTRVDGHDVGLFRQNHEKIVSFAK